MAINWVTVLAAVPWTEVIKNAPKVAEGAKKLWSTVGNKEGKASPSRVATSQAAGPTARLAELEARVEELTQQMQASAELIKALAEQNAQLVQRIESNRRRTVALSVVVLLLLVGLIFLVQR
jgi:outer membrane murein-binding lipoprotein Lpp